MKPPEDQLRSPREPILPSDRRNCVRFNRTRTCFKMNVLTQKPCHDIVPCHWLTRLRRVWEHFSDYGVRIQRRNTRAGHVWAAPPLEPT